MSNCICGGPLIPCRVNIMEDKKLKGTVCFKLFCPKCGNSLLDSYGRVIYYTYMGDGARNVNYDRMKFWTPDEVPFSAKGEFINTVLRMCDSFTGNQYFTMDEIRKEWRNKNG